MLDRYDLKILDLWQQRGDIGPVEMSEAIHLSASQCSRRMAALKRAGHVRGFHAVLEPARIGIGLMAYVLITMKSHGPEAAEAFRARILALDEVLECQKLTGEADIILKVATHDLASFNRLLSHRILSAPEVATARSSIILEDVKRTTALPIRPGSWG
jgi:DNA-binding Lrp family transcriptional regulator